MRVIFSPTPRSGIIISHPSSFDKCWSWTRHAHAWGGHASMWNLISCLKTFNMHWNSDIPVPDDDHLAVAQPLVGYLQLQNLPLGCRKMPDRGTSGILDKSRFLSLEICNSRCHSGELHHSLFRVSEGVVETSTSMSFGGSKSSSHSSSNMPSPLSTPLLLLQSDSWVRGVWARISRSTWFETS